jgi:hypothetical protein
MKTSPLASIALDDLAVVTGGGESLCKFNGGIWRPAPPNRTLDGNVPFKDKPSCVAAVQQWKTSLMNIDNDRAD